MKNLFSFIVILLAAQYGYSHVRLPKIFGDNMVLQRNKLIPVWGWADPNERITVKFNKQIKKSVADAKGKWMIKLNEEQAGGPFELIVTGNNSIRISNVLVGEVWICSGQSNMEMPIEGWGKINNYEKEIAAAKLSGNTAYKNTEPYKFISTG